MSGIEWPYRIWPERLSTHWVDDAKFKGRACAYGAPAATPPGELPMALQRTWQRFFDDAWRTTLQRLKMREAQITMMGRNRFQRKRRRK